MLVSATNFTELGEFPRVMHALSSFGTAVTLPLQSALSKSCVWPEQVPPAVLHAHGVHVIGCEAAAAMTARDAA